MTNFYTPYNNYPFMGQMMGQPQNNLDWIMAASVKQVEQVSVQPGQKAWVMVQNEPIFALRTADQMGLITTDYYRFEKINPDDAAVEYVTRAEFNKFIDSLKPKKKGDTE